MLSSDKDISRLLREWKYDPERVNVRRLIGEDGKEKIQLRVDLGILQMEASGRPDGKRPFGKESLLEYFQSRLRDGGKETDDKSGFLNHEDCLKLQQEAVQYYHRYLSLFHLGDFEGVIRDTHRNLRVFELVRNHAKDPHDRVSLEQYHPFVLMMHTRAKASIALRDKAFDQAIALIKEGIAGIRALHQRDGEDTDKETSPEIQFLQRWIEEIAELKPVDPIQRLEREMNDAVAAENFELAAKLRDEMREKKNDLPLA